MTDSVLIIGATSGIAKAIADELARERRPRFVLAARLEEDIERVAADLRTRFGVEVAGVAFEAREFDAYAEFWRACEDAAAGGIDAVIICHGTMPAQGRDVRAVAEIRETVDVNLTSYLCLIGLAADAFEARGRGTIVALSSVAGDRGRASNYLYAATKAGVSAYLDGIRGRLRRAGVRVITVKPGPVDTPMTRGQGRLPFLVPPEVVAKDVVRAMARGTDVVYSPGRWRPIMAIIRMLPTGVFKRLKL